MIIQLTIVGPLMRGLQGGVSSIFGWNTGIGSPGNSMTGAAGDPTAGGTFLTASAMGNVFDRGNMIHAYAQGGIIDRPTVFGMANGGLALTGEAGPEAVMPLKRGPDGRLGVSGQGGGSTVNIQMGHINIDASGADPAVVARLQATLESFRKSQYSDTVKIVQDASNRGMRLHP
jgi:lambda family phage tail tape measure protein